MTPTLASCLLRMISDTDGRSWLNLPCCCCLRARQILVVVSMGQEKPRRSIPLASCPLDGVVKCAGFWVAITHHLVVLDNQVHVILTGTPEPIFQRQALVTGFHWLPQALWT